ncbi:hypothetical protein [Ancylomarina longa]|nr:hypothetical protein [Ancylomarina longa]
MIKLGEQSPNRAGNRQNWRRPAKIRRGIAKCGEESTLWAEVGQLG